MVKRTIFNLLRYLSLSAAEKRTLELSKDELKEKLFSENFMFEGSDLDCAYTLYLKYFDEYKTEIKYGAKFFIGENNYEI